MIKAAPTLLAALFAASVIIASARLPASATNPQLERISVTTAGAEVHGASMMAMVSANGHFVVFASDAPDVLPDNGASRDIFLRDRQAGAIELVSVATDGGEPDGLSLFPDISADGRFVVFESFAGDLVDDDNQGFTDIFVRDRQEATTRRVNLTPEGGDLNNDSLTPSISGSGRYVTYTSLASTAVATDSNGDRDVFLVDLQTNITELVSIATDGTQGDLNSGGLGAGEGHVTSDGRYVVYGSFATTLVPNDLNGKDDIFVRDRLNGTTERVSISTEGTEGNDHSLYGSISNDGRYVVYYSSADDLVPDDNNGVADVFLRDRQTGETTRISGGTGANEANGASRFPDISDDGRFVVFQSSAGNLAPNDTDAFFDIFRYDMQTGQAERISVPAVGDEAHGSSTDPQVSADGSVVTFQSAADNLIPLDNNSVVDVFAWGKPPDVGPTETPTRTSTPHPTITPTQTPQGCPPQRGDVNGDGNANSIDAALILQFTAGLLTSISPSADINHDGSANSIDAALILQFSAGLLTCLPP